MTQVRPCKTPGLIGFQTIRHADGISERIFRKVNFVKKSADEKKNEKLPSMQRVIKSLVSSCLINYINVIIDISIIYYMYIWVQIRWFFNYNSLHAG